MSRMFVVLAALALVAAACGPSATTTPQNDAAGVDRQVQNDAALDTAPQPDAPVQADGPVQHDGPVQSDTAVQNDAGPATLYADIRALQQDPTYTGTLAPVGSRVRIEGAVVTASSATASQFFMQNATGPQEYSGIVVKKNATVATMPAVGDVVTAIEATLVEEVRSCNVDANVCPTRHALTNVTLFTVNAGAGTVPAPLAISTTDLKTTPAKYDGVLAQLNDNPLTVTAVAGAGSSITMTVATNVAFYSYYYAPPGVPPVGTVIISSTGIGVVDIYSTGWRLYPRSIADLQFQDWPPDAGVQQDATVTTDATAPGDATACGTDNVVISQAFGGGGNSGAPYNADFVELFNRGSTTADVGTWSVQYSSAAGTSFSGKADLTGKTIPAGGYLLVQMSGTGANGVALPTPDVTAATLVAMAKDNFKVALVKNQTLLTAGCPTLPSVDIADFVGTGSANCSEGGQTTPVLSNTTDAQRKGSGCQDYDNNAYDFTVAAPLTPRNSATTPAPCGC